MPWPKYCPRGHPLFFFENEQGRGMRCNSAWHQWSIAEEDLDDYSKDLENE